MNESVTPAKYITPRYWLTWCGFGVLWCVNRLPFNLQMTTGKWLGRLLFHITQRRKRIAKVNLRLCFPDLAESQRRQILKKHFESLGIMIIEMGLSWWTPTEKLKERVTIEGMEYLLPALSGGNGVILLAAHFTTLEISGPLFTLFMPACAMYRPHENPLINSIMERGRKRHLTSAIPREEIRTMLRVLKNNEIVWYACDQGYREQQSIIVPFFGIPASANGATSRLARISGAAIMPFVTYRRDDNSGYIIKISPPIENYPTDNPETDAIRINKIIEEQIMAHPEQYFWVHRRFKRRDKTTQDIYESR